MALPLYAVVSFYALRWAFAYRLAAIALGAILVITWGIRFAGLGYYLADAAYDYQREWRNAELPGEAHEHDPAITTPLIARMRADALSRAFPDPAQVLPPTIRKLLRDTH